MPDRAEDLRRLSGVLRTAVRLWWRHWPALVALACLGVAIRAGILWLAVHVSDAHHLSGQLLLILGPPGFLIPLIGAMYVCRASLPRLAQLAELRGRDMPLSRRPERLIDIAASVLLPFLAIYESYGLFEDDVDRFRNAAGVAELAKAFDGRQLDLGGRLGLYGVPAAIGFIGGGWLLRAGLGWVEGRRELFVLGFVGALGDVTYTSQIAAQLTYLSDIAGQWLRERQAWHWIASSYDDLQKAAGLFAGPARLVAEVFVGVTDSWEQLVLVPAGWLAVGLVVLGRQEGEEEAEAHGGDQATGRRRRSLPARVVLAVVGDVRRRIGVLWQALRTLGASGLYPTLGFSLILLVVVRLPGLLYPAAHLLLGPSTTDTYLAFSPILDAVILATSMAITIPLVAAGVDFLVTSRLEGEGLTADLDVRVSRPVAPPSAAEAAAGDAFGDAAGDVSGGADGGTGQPVGSST